MKISGFTFLRNADSNGYPFIESIRSDAHLLSIEVRPCCRGDRASVIGRDEIESIGNPKVKIVDADWNENMRDRGSGLCHTK